MASMTRSLSKLPSGGQLGSTAVLLWNGATTSQIWLKDYVIWALWAMGILGEMPVFAEHLVLGQLCAAKYEWGKHPIHVGGRIDLVSG